MTECPVDVEEVMVSDADLAAVSAPTITAINCGPAQTVISCSLCCTR